MSVVRNLTSLALFTLAAVALPAQTTVTLTATADNTLYQNATGALSNGKGIGIFVGMTGGGVATRAVLRFNVAASIPAGATIVGARLTLDAAQSNYPLPLQVTGHRLLQNWGEGTSVAPLGGGGGAAATAGDATWLHTFFNTSLWTTAGGTFGPATFAWDTPAFGLSSSSDGPATVADVQFWLDNPAQDFGWLLKSDETLPAPTARRFVSRDATTGTKPRLTVTYLLPGQIGTWGTGCPTTAGTFGTNWIGPMIGGTTVQLGHTGATPNSVGVNYFALDLYQPGALLLPSCNLYLPITLSWIPGFVFLTDGAGNGVPAAWNVPSIYPGLYFVSQSAVLDGSPFGLALSNAAVAVIQ
ncbi:MAG: hypothetical protein JNL08_12730 [Planctomycetes bacterium]|nr:hypothetical protein [Planctomycetota bacterium]